MIDQAAGVDGVMSAWESENCRAETDPLFWANKLHSCISGLSFYNFPYLFSLGVYARRAEFGDAFFPRYEAVLRDTGRMTAEDLATKHLEVDLTHTDFWRDTVAALEPRIDRFEELVDQVATGMTVTPGCPGSEVVPNSYESPPRAPGSSASMSARSFGRPVACLFSSNAARLMNGTSRSPTSWVMRPVQAASKTSPVTLVMMSIRRGGKPS